MVKILDLEQGRDRVVARKAFRNWTTRFKEPLGRRRAWRISPWGRWHTWHGLRKDGPFLLYDLIMQVERLGSGFTFPELHPKKKMAVIDRYLFVLDQIRFECMRRLGWLESYPGEGLGLVEMVRDFERLGPGLHAGVAVLSRTHPDHEEYRRLHTLDREAFVRRLTPKAIQEIQALSKTLET